MCGSKRVSVHVCLQSSVLTCARGMRILSLAWLSNACECTYVVLSACTYVVLSVCMYVRGVVFTHVVLSACMYVVLSYLALAKCLMYVCARRKCLQQWARFMICCVCVHVYGRV